MKLFTKLVLTACIFIALSCSKKSDPQPATVVTPPQKIPSDPKYIYYTNPFSGTIEKTDGTTNIILATTGGFNAGIAIASDGNLYVGDQRLQTLARFTIDGTPVGSSFGTSGRTYIGIVIGPDKQLYASQNDGGSSNGIIERYNPATGVGNGSSFAETDVAAYTTLNKPSYFEGVTFGPDSNLYCASKHTSSIMVYQGPKGDSPGAFIKELTGASEASGLAFGPDGKLYVTEFNNNVVVRYNGTSFEPFIDNQILKGPQGIVFGKDGYVYVASTTYGNNGTIHRFQGPSGTTPGKFVDAFGYPSSGGPNYMVMSDK